MPLCGRYRCGAVSIAVWRVEETLEELLQLLNFTDASCVRGFASAERQRERLAARVLLKEMCGATAGIVYDAAGKPSLASGDAYISLSHTRGYVALAVSPQAPVGLDVELADREVGRVSRRFMREDELAGVPAHLCNAAKLLRWTASEALFKLVGDLGGNYRDNIVLQSSLPAPSGVLSLSLVGLGCGAGSYSVSYLFDAALLLTVCLEGSGYPLQAVGGC